MKRSAGGVGWVRLPVYARRHRSGRGGRSTSLLAVTPPRSPSDRSARPSPGGLLQPGPFAHERGLAGCRGPGLSGYPLNAPRGNGDGLIRFGLLGPLLVESEGSRVEIPAAKLRTVLALLVARRNTPLNRSRIVGELWPEQPPRSAVENVRTYVSAIRGLLGSQRDRLISRQGSYLLEIDDNELDAAIFLTLVKQARSDLAAGDLAGALERYADAMVLWRGDVLQDVPAGPALRSYGAILAASSVEAREEYFEVLFSSGDTGAAVAGLRQLLADDPTRESAWYKLISILYRSGDRATALATYQRARAHLAEGLGLDPGPELVALHRKILQGLPADRPKKSPPRQLPRPPGLLVGRDAELKILRRMLTQPREVSAVVAIHGLGGTGKSTLAIAAAHAVAHQYPDGQLYVDLQGSSSGGRPLEPAEVLCRFLRTLGVPESQISPDVEGAAPLFRSITAPQRILFVLDNALSAEQVLPLLPAGPGCGALITSRRALDTLDTVDHIQLPVLTETDAVSLLRSLAGHRVEQEPDAALDIVRLCGSLPLAVRIMGIRLARQPGIRLCHVANRLARAGRRLDELGCGELDVRSAFHVGYQFLLDKPAGQMARQLLWRLGRWPLGEISVEDAAALLGVTEPDAWRALELLADHGLVQPTGSGFVMHDLVRLFAAELAEANESDADVDAAFAHVIDRYASLVRRSRLLYLPGDGDPPHLEDGGLDPVPEDEDEAASWVAKHLPTIAALTRQATQSPRTAGLAWRLVYPLTWRLAIHHPAACVQLYTILVSGPPPPDIHDLARAWCSLSTGHLYLGRYEEARRIAQRAVELLPQLHDAALVARIKCVYGTPLARTGDPERALQYTIEAALLFQELSRPRPVTICLTNAAEAAIALGRHGEALTLLKRSLAIARRHGDAHQISGILDSLATVHLRLGHFRATIWHATAAIRHCAAAPNTLMHSEALQKRALAWQALGQSRQAISDAEASVALCEAADMPHLLLGARRNLGVILWLLGDPAACEVLREADLLAQSIKDSSQ